MQLIPVEHSDGLFILQTADYIYDSILFSKRLIRSNFTFIMLVEARNCLSRTRRYIYKSATLRCLSDYVSMYDVQVYVRCCTRLCLHASDGLVVETILCATVIE